MTQGTFVWYDQMSDDIRVSEKFYASVCNWTIGANTMNAQDYSILQIPGNPMGVGGLMPIPADAKAMGARATWMGYVSVDDVDAMAGKVAAAGGRVMKPASDIPNVGRFAVVGDPDGAGFILFKPNGTPPPGYVPPAQGTPGTIGWHELHSSDHERAMAFYSGLFGWKKDHAHDMGPMGIYQTFKIGETQGGGMMNKGPQTPKAHWLYYVNVPAADDAAAKVKAGGGTVLNGPMEVPGDLWTVQALDPQGAMFGLLAPKR